MSVTTQKLCIITGPDSVEEYAGVKPDEFVTLDKKSLQQHGQIICTRHTTLKSTNSCSTLKKKSKPNSGSDKVPRLYGHTNLAYEDTEMQLVNSKFTEEDENVNHWTQHHPQLAYDSGSVPQQLYCIFAPVQENLQNITRKTFLVPQQNIFMVSIGVPMHGDSD